MAYRASVLSGFKGIAVVKFREFQEFQQCRTRWSCNLPSYKIVKLSRRCLNRIIKKWQEKHKRWYYLGGVKLQIRGGNSGM